MACLDTTVLLDLMGRGGARGRRRVERVLAEQQDAGEDLVTTRFSVAELWVGIARSKDPTRARAAVDAVLTDLGILEFDDEAARAFGHIVGRLQDVGRPVGDMDALIAAVALVNDQSVVTGNPKHFKEIAGLVVETY